MEFFEFKIRISPRKRIFQQNLFCLYKSGAQVGSINEIKAKQSCDTVTLTFKVDLIGSKVVKGTSSFKLNQGSTIGQWTY